MAKNCAYNGREYSDGAVVCQNGAEYRCDEGRWEPLGSSCSREDGAQHGWSSEPLVGCTTEMSRTKVSQEGAFCECVGSDSPALEHPAGSPCAGLWAYAVGWIEGDERLVAITKDWGSSQMSLGILQGCYGDRAKGVTYYGGGRQLLCAPCLSCSIGGQAC